MRGTLANGEQVQKARVSRGLTKEQLAVRAGLDVKTVRKAEQGKRLDFVSLARLASAMELELGQVFPKETGVSARRLILAERVLDWNRAWEAQEIESVLAHYHEDAVMYLPGDPNIPFGGEYRGKQAIRLANERAWATCRTEPSRPDDSNLIVSDGTVVLRAIKGVYLPDGSVARIWCLQVFTFHDELILEHRVEYDTLKFSQLLQLPGTEKLQGASPEVP